MTFEHHQIWVAKLHSDESLRFVSRERYRVIIEVKTVIKVGEVLRQLKLYTEYVKGARLVLVSTVPATSLEHQALNDEGVVVVVLGESFECRSLRRVFRRFEERSKIPTKPVFFPEHGLFSL